MKSAPAMRVTVAVALALQSGCAVAPSPPAPVTPPATASAATISLFPSPTPSAAGDAGPVFIAWQTDGEGAELLLVGADGRLERLPLPARPNGPVAAGLRGPMYFLSGSAAGSMLWTSHGSLSGPRWTTQRLFRAGPGEEELAWLCAAPGDPPGAVAVQSKDNLVYLIGADGRLRLLPPDRLFLRPGGCAWTDSGHLLVAADEARMLHHIAFAIFRVDDGTSRLLDGIGGEQPAVSDVSLAYVARDGPAGNVVLVGPIPAPGGGLPPATSRLEPVGQAALFRPVLSADGKRLAVVELGPKAAPSRILLYELPRPTLVMELDVRGADDAGPVWVANPPTG